MTIPQKRSWSTAIHIYPLSLLPIMLLPFGFSSIFVELEGLCAAW
ncbi:unnamed protein product [Strongylus vulgaris]|uniref:Uncharacterized protein n=1 Tax=Strongylus vulgaris TaxID=40348 RepID=A0A3P7J0H7_STRVU|nr:unnamed protein product [Strongylus vulgaris]